uniref:Prephenate/arogenate dehydrogenase domain-containing protein n=1 Tax=Oryza rufipogon TaxID=4529 RepID=A0A0E0PYW0_ORYRU
MASSPRHSTHHPTLLLRRHYPNFCALAPLRPTRQLPSLPQQQLRQKQHVGHDPSPSEPTTAAASPATAAAAGALRVGIVGFGNFGQFIAGGIQRQGHAVLATSRSDYSGYCARHGIRFFATADELCEAGPDVLLVCSSILSTEAVVRAIPFRKLRPGTLVADVLSVKQFPRNLLLEILPPGFGIVCTHPMFGPESGKHGWSGLPFVYDKVRVAKEGDQAAKCEQFLSIFEREGCRMVEMLCEEHDRYAAGSQFITHTIGRILSQLNLESTPINTKGYETLLQLTKNTISDSFDLYYGLFMYNIDNLDRAFEKVKQMLYGRLHNVLRKQIVERVPIP